MRSRRDNLIPTSRPRIIVIAGDKRSGYMKAAVLGITPVAVVTPRSPHAAHGVLADDIIMDEISLTPEWREKLLPEVLPAIATSRAGRDG
jgi:hypothetical protein